MKLDRFVVFALVWVAVIATALTGAAPARADTGSIVSSSLSISVLPGLGGAIKPGNWAPVEVDIANEGRDITGQIQISFENQVSPSFFSPPPVVYTTPAILPAHSHKRLEVDVFVPLQANRLHVNLVEGRTTVAQQEAPFIPASANNLLCGAIGGSANAYSTLETIDIPGRQQRPRMVSLSASELPSRPQLLGSLDCLIVGNASMASLTTAQKNALEAWVGHGGLLVGIGGETWARDLPYLPAGLLPVDVAGSRTLPALPALATFGNAPLPAGGPWVVSVPKRASGTTVIQQGSVPLLTVWRHGAGSVFYLAIDPEAGPLRGWSGNARLWQYVLSFANAPLVSRSPFGTTMMGWGRPPRTALEKVPSLAPPSPLWYGALLLAYLMLLGPGTYLLLRRIDRREWAVVTVPLLALTTTVAAFHFAADRKGSDVGINEISLVRTDVGTSTSYVRTYVSVYSPRDTGYQLVTPAGALITGSAGNLRLSPANQSSLPGISSNFSHSGPARPITVIEGSTTTLPDFRAQTDHLSGFTVDSVVRLPGTIVSDLTTDGTSIQGKVTNNTGQQIDGAVVLLDGRVMARLGTFAPHEAKAISLPFPSSGKPRSASLSSVLFPVTTDRQHVSADVTIKRDVVDSAFNPFFRSSAISDGGLLFLGWMEQTPLPVTVSGGRASVQTHTLYTVGLPLHPAPGRQVEIPSVTMATQQIASLAVSRQNGAYDLASGGAISLQFSLPFTGAFQPARLTLHVAGTVGQSTPITTATDLGAAAWYDWTNGVWVDLPVSVGANVIAAPARFISPAGEVRLRYTYKPTTPGSAQSLSLTRFDVSMAGSAP